MDILDDMGVSKLSAKVFFQELKKKNFKKKKFNSNGNVGKKNYS